MQRHHDKVIQEKDNEIACLRAQIEIPRTLEKILDKFDFQHGHEVATNVDPIVGFSTNVTHHKLDNSTGFTSDRDSETDTHEYAVNDLPYGTLKVEAYVADKGKTTAAVPILPDDLLMKSKRRSKFECPMDIVYGHPKRTRSS
ncbi:hypothetical protein M0R45_036542 [Rubus argutus]|uniref:Uncharacterized protein n=1 Tax=Rubus argutus TaxID=59490 RepID=A0AAW1VXB4_RUBAR